MWARAKVLLIVLATALSVLPLGGLAGDVTQPTGVSGEIYLLSFETQDVIRILPALGMKVLVDYNNGYYLVQGPVYEEADLQVLGINMQPMPDRTVIKFPASGYSFDTMTAIPSIPPGFESVNSVEKIVQFIGPIKAEWVNAIESLGVIFTDYVDGYAYIVKMTDEQAVVVSSLPFVNWIGQYHPAYKIQSELLEFSGFVRAAVVGYEGVSEVGMDAFLMSLGAEIITSWSEPTSAKILIHSSMIPIIAKSPNIYQIYWSPEEELYDWQAGEVHYFHQAWEPSKNGLRTNLTGHSPGPDGIMGTADDIFEVIGIQDSGFDANNADAGWDDVFQGPLGDRVIALRRRTGQCSQPDGRISGSAHGTHVAGIVLSNGFDWEYANLLPTDDFEWYYSEAGSVPEGKLSFDCVGVGGGISASPAYWDDQYADGAKTMSNSYGNRNRIYDATAIAIDQRIDASNDKMILFAVGNDGPDPNTVSGMAKAKNGLAIGASQNYRPDQFEADNPNLLSDFSSRGNPGERFKPDLVAVGTAVVSGLGYGEWLYNAGPGGQGVPQPSYIMEVDVYRYTAPGTFTGDGIADYTYNQGTSMASPQAAGLYMLTREYFREVWGIDNVNSQLAKALLINGAVRMDENLYAYPSIDQGWGRIDLKQSLFPPAPRTNQFEEGLFSTTGTWRPSSIIMDVKTPDVPLKVTLVWIDPAGSLLQRNLNLIVRDPTGTVEYHGNQYATTGSLKGWTDPSIPSFDSINNVEQVEVQFPSPGSWSVEVIGANIPSTARFALIFSADVGPIKRYQVNMYTKYPTLVSVTPGGTASLPFVVRNFGSELDTVIVSHDSTIIGVSTEWALEYFDPNQFKDNMALFYAPPATPPGLYPFCIIAESVNDTETPKSSDSICVQVSVVDQRLPYPRRITTGDIDELDPSVLTFNRSGVNHIFIAYRKTTPLDPMDLTHGGVNVWIAHNTLDANHEPVNPWNHTSVSDWNDYPNDLRMLYIDWGTFDGRVILTWTGQDPLESVPESKPYGRIAFSDPPYTNWTLRTIQKNYGSNVYNSARVSFPIFRKAGGPNGTLAWIWEHLDSVSTEAPGISAVQTHIAFSPDGGNSWGDCYATPSECYLIAPRSTSNYYFFPNGVVDQNDVLWVVFYWRLPAAGQGRRLAVALWDGATWDPNNPTAGWTSAINIWDAGGNVNVQFPAALSTPEGGNRVYIAVTNDGGALDKRLYTLYAEGTFGSNIIGPPPAAAPSPGVSSDFSTPQGPLGNAVSDANYNRRPVLNMVYTDDGLVWIPYMESSNLYGVPNMWTYYSGDTFASDRRKTEVTADAFAKGHQMSDSLTIGSKSCVYEVWHENIAPPGEVNYDVYLAIYCQGWETDPDNLGPVTVNQATIPNPYNRTFPSSFRVKADISDIATGFNNISAAQLVMTATTVSDPALVDWTNAWAMNLTGVNVNPTETAWLWANWTVSGWAVGECHRFWIRGQDDQSNWGTGDFVDVCVTEAVKTPPPAPMMQKAILTGIGYADVELTWAKSFNDGNGANDVVLYKVFKALDIYGPYVNVDNITATKSPTYTWTDSGAGHNDFQNYFYYVVANSTAYDSKPTKIAGKFYRTMSGGKQLLAYPLTQFDASPMAVFQTIPFDSVRTYTPIDTSDPWKSYKPGRTINDISGLTVSRGYWVDMTAPETMTVAGIVPENVVIDMSVPGWYLVPFPSFNNTPFTIDMLNTALGSVIDAVEVYESTAGPYYLQRLSQSDWSTTQMMPGEAYWIHITAAAAWAVPGI